MDISSSYLRERPGSRNYWFRIAVPSDQREQFGKPEISFSLHTANVLVAKKQALQWAQEYQQQFARGRREARRRCLDGEGVDTLIVEMSRRVLDIYDQALDCADMSPAEYFDRWRHSALHHDFLQNLLCEFDFQPDLSNDNGARLRQTFDALVDTSVKLIQQEYALLQSAEAEAAKARARYNRRVSTGAQVPPMPRPEVVQALSGSGDIRCLAERSGFPAASDACRDGDDRRAGFSPRQTSTMCGANPAPTDACTPQPTLDDLIDHWATEQGHDRNAKTEDAVRAVFKEFAAYAHVKYAAEVTTDMVIGFKTFLLTRGRGSAASEGNNVAKGGRPNSNVTVHKKLGLLKAIFNHALDNRLIRQNPAERVRVKLPKNRPKSRLPFDANDIARIFGTPLFMSKVLPKYAGAGGEAAYWMPLLQCFSGARKEEVGQLYVADVRYYRSQKGEQIPYLEINNLDGKGTKNANSNRSVPLHPELIRRGFLDYVGSQAPESRLFPLLRPDKYGDLTAEFSKWFNGIYLRRELGITDPKKVDHSFRHYFITMCRNSGMDLRFEYAITGHKLGAVHEGYGDSLPVTVLYDALKQVRFDGFPF